MNIPEPHDDAEWNSLFATYRPVPLPADFVEQVLAETRAQIRRRRLACIGALALIVLAMLPLALMALGSLGWFDGFLENLETVSEKILHADESLAGLAAAFEPIQVALAAWLPILFHFALQALPVAALVAVLAALSLRFLCSTLLNPSLKS